MTARRFASKIALGVFAWMMLLHPAVAQQVLPSVGSGTSTPATEDSQGLPAASEPDHDTPQIAAAAPSRKEHEGADSSDTLNLQASFKRTTTAFTYAFTPAGTQGVSALNGSHGSEQWGNSVAGAFRAYANDSTSFLMTADLETVGQQAKANELGLPGGEDVLLEYLGTHSLLLDASHPRSCELGFGVFQHWMVSSPMSSGGLFRGQLPGYALDSRGLETTLTLPDSNASFTVRYGSEHLANDSRRKPVVGFELSWNW